MIDGYGAHRYSPSAATLSSSISPCDADSASVAAEKSWSCYNGQLTSLISTERRDAHLSLDQLIQILQRLGL
jgi:hypothetical protein